MNVYVINSRSVNNTVVVKMSRIENMLNPKVVALIGASEKEGSIGNQIMKNLLTGKGRRTIYPINPAYQTVMGLKCFQGITQVP